MRISITKEQVEDILQNYYQTYEHEDVTIQSKAIQSCVGLYETPCVVVKINAITKINLLGEVVENEEELSENQLRDIFQTILEEQGYSIEDISYDAGMDTDDRFQSKSAYFKGININVQHKRNQKLKVMN